MNKVEIIADSKNEFGQRITTAILTFPRYLLAEVNTHRMLSRNSASSRAIRFEKMVKSVIENPFIPFKWQKDHAGMQGTEYFTDLEVEELMLESNWLLARDYAVEQASNLNKQGLTKQLCNRLLEPFMYHTVLLTGTDLENFFALRAQDAAEIHFQDLAYKFLNAMNASEPKQLQAGEWHIPFGDKFSGDNLYSFLETLGWNYQPNWDTDKQYQERRNVYELLKVKLATVRAARVSYLNQGKETSIEEDIALHDRLASSGHWSAFEHCARAMSADEYEQFALIVPRQWPTAPQKYFADTKVQGICGNFQGFIQYRKMFANENRADSRLIKK